MAGEGLLDFSALFPSRPGAAATDLSRFFTPNTGVSGQYGGVGGGAAAPLRGLPGQAAASAAPQTASVAGRTGPGGMVAPLAPGAIYGSGGKWSGGSGLDLFTQRGEPVIAMFDGQVRPDYSNQSPFGPVPSFILSGQNGMSAQYTHVQGTRQGPVRAGDVIGYVDDPSLDVLGAYPGMPGNFQHLDLRLGRGNGPFTVTGGDVDVRQTLGQMGYQGRAVQGVTRGPNGGGGGGLGGFGGGQGSPFGGQGSPFGGGGGGLGGYAQMGLGGGFGGAGQMGGGFGQMGMPALPGWPGGGGFRGGAYPGQGFGGFGQFGMQQGLVPGTAGVGGGQFGGFPFGQGTAMGPVTGSAGTYGGPPPMLPFSMPQGQFGGLGGQGMGMGGFGLGSLF